MNAQKKKLLGQLLIEKNMITESQLEDALRKQKKAGDLLGSILVQIGFVDCEMDLLPVIAEQHGVGYIYIKNLLLDEDVIGRIPYHFAHDHHVLALDYFNDVLTVAMSKPYDITLCNEISRLTNVKINPILAGRFDIDEAIQKYYGVDPSEVHG